MGRFCVCLYCFSFVLFGFCLFFVHFGGIFKCLCIFFSFCLWFVSFVLFVCSFCIGTTQHTKQTFNINKQPKHPKELKHKHLQSHQHGATHSYGIRHTNANKFVCCLDLFFYLFVCFFVCLFDWLFVDVGRQKSNKTNIQKKQTATENQTTKQTHKHAQISTHKHADKHPNTQTLRQTRPDKHRKTWTNTNTQTDKHTQTIIFKQRAKQNTVLNNIWIDCSCSFIIWVSSSCLLSFNFVSSSIQIHKINLRVSFKLNLGFVSIKTEHLMFLLKQNLN